ncbi:MAG TPA: hypothetical protein DCF82_04940 [Marinobacter hydrocarbonoclasticus]|jgi:transcription elongation factor Elf1|uniref:Uncharacterized protein n=1 Tax=Marinobacter nauticus TaxID=2743 RepID=A0A3B8WD03_MARNT|nr:hypothetical protein [Marinobacter nauticus]
MHDIKWQCPDCKAKNANHPDKTAFPECRKCDKKFDWLDIAHTSDNMDIYLAAVDALAMKTCGKCALDLIDDQDAGVDALKDAFLNGERPVKALIRVRKLAAA